jgi:hypothetical protein
MDEGDQWPDLSAAVDERTQRREERRKRVEQQKSTGMKPKQKGKANDGGGDEVDSSKQPRGRSKSRSKSTERGRSVSKSAKNVDGPRSRSQSKAPRRSISKTPSGRDRSKSVGRRRSKSADEKRNRSKSAEGRRKDPPENIPAEGTKRKKKSIELRNSVRAFRTTRTRRALRRRELRIRGKTAGPTLARPPSPRRRHGDIAQQFALSLLWVFAPVLRGECTRDWLRHSVSYKGGTPSVPFETPTTGKLSPCDLQVNFQSKATIMVYSSGTSVSMTRCLGPGMTISRRTGPAALLEPSGCFRMS